jgi:hypothetical protein
MARLCHGWNRVNVSENLGATAVILVALVQVRNHEKL